jgi:hypothetical protein
VIQCCWLIQTDTWAGSRAWSTTVARSSWTEFRSTVLATLLAATGARQFCAIRSYLSTGAKHGLTFS